MDFADKLKELAARIPAHREFIRTEEATKNALVMPFITALGYNVFDPKEVTPELCADVGLKKGEKVDYAILKDGKPIMLFECKGLDCNLDVVHASQLYRYFSVTEARIGVLTNGEIYRFFADLEAANKMDSKPFLEVSLLQLDDTALIELKKLCKGIFELPAILASASDLKYMREIKRVLALEMQEPSDELIRFFVSKTYEGRLTQTVREQFSGLIKRGLQQFVSDRVSDRLRSALAEEQTAAKTNQEAEIVAVVEDKPVTTDEERDSYNIVRAILSELVDPHRITLRDQQSYCSILLDNNNRRPICRLWFNGSRKTIGLFDDSKSETRVPITEPLEIFRHAAHLKATVLRYKKAPAAEASSLDGAVS
jgi:hypothetical protein